MKVPPFKLVISWSDDDEAFVADVPELPGCSADGATYMEAIGNVEIVIREWIETARELGRRLPMPSGRSLEKSEQPRHFE